MKSSICAILLGYILSIVVFRELVFSLGVSIAVLIGIQIAIFILHVFTIKKEYFLLFVIEISIGIGFLQGYHERIERANFKTAVEHMYLLKRKALFYGKVSDIPFIKDGRTRIKVLLEYVQFRHSTKKKIEGSIFLYIRQELDIHNHDTITFISRLSQIENFSEDFDYVAYCTRYKVQYLARLYSEKDIKSINHPHQMLFRFLDDKIRELNAFFNKYDETGIVKATILGDKSDLDESINSIFKKTGTAHLIVISGFHIAFLFFFISFILIKLLFECGGHRHSFYYKKIAYIITTIILLIYLYLLNYQVPALRAFIFIFLYVVSFLFNVNISRISIIFFSAYLILLIDPQSLYSASFQLSFACVLTIELLGLPLIAWRHKRKEIELNTHSRLHGFMNKVNSVNGIPIRLTYERWYHIIENHDDMASYFHEVLWTKP